MNTHTLIIGYGNPLRGDDGVGPAAADVVRSWDVPGVHVVTCQQLVPELIEEMKAVKRVLFIDAKADIEEPAFTARIVEPTKTRLSLGHHQTPANLLAILRELEGYRPQAWLITIAVESFDHGDAMTSTARANMNAALAWMHQWLRCQPS
jgi:hydrogenase maturation protease